MSQVFHGVVVRCADTEARALFGALHSRLPLRLVELDEDVFGIYVIRDFDAFDELRQIAASVSLTTGCALFYWYDSRVGDWCQLFELGSMTRELHPERPKGWGKGDPLEAIGASRSLHKVVEEAFLYNMRAPIAVHQPHLQR